MKRKEADILGNLYKENYKRETFVGYERTKCAFGYLLKWVEIRTYHGKGIPYNSTQN